MSRTWNIKRQRTLATTRVYNLCVYRSYTNRNTTQGNKAGPTTLSSLLLLAHDFMLEGNIPSMICTSTYTAMPSWTIDSVLCTHSMILQNSLPTMRSNTLRHMTTSSKSRPLYGQTLSISIALFLYKYCLPKPWLLFMLLNISQDWSTIYVTK
jgi:hypothetical protein